jgi:dipeptidyl aminopeptidase/acylaminoacyl peptidase
MRVAPYGSWKSPITSSLIVGQSIGLSEVRIADGHIYWLESRPQERGRSVVVRDGVELTPAPWNVRDRVHEYGGGAWTVADGALYFSNYADRRLYRLARGSAQPAALTPEGAWRYADGIVDSRGWWMGVREDHSQGGEPANELVVVGPGGIEVLAHGHDFYSSPRLSRDGRLAYLAWDHPNMPWDGTTLYVDDAVIAGGPAESIFQPEWAPDGSALFFASDRTGWWNLYRWDAATGATQAIAPRQAEFGVAQWVMGMSTYAFAGASRIVCAYSGGGLGRLAAIDLNTGAFAPIETPYTEISSVRAEGDVVVFRGASATQPASIVRLDLRTGRYDVLKKATAVADDPAIAPYLARVEQLDYASEGRTAHALHYPAANPEFTAPEGERPPLIVNCHGGPTSSASSALDLRISFWTSRGVSVLDVNYGGSTGYGRAYRELLKGQWGVVDVDDCVNGARALAERGLADPARCVIAGGSAGGFTALAALTFRDWFRGGVSRYGVSDLSLLAADTHKFESRYLEGLAGGHYEERSPIRHAERLKAPVIFLQGDEDLVVPPNQTERMVEALRANRVPAAYLLFSGEQHGFRQAAAIQRALDAELLFLAANVFRCALTF